MPALTLGYKASAEQFPPQRLLDLAVAAEDAGFDSVWTSDHFQPWRHTDGHAPNALAWLGAATQATQRVTLGTSVLTPVVPLQPGDRRAGLRDARLPRARPDDPGRRHRREPQRGARGRGLARAERAVRAPARGRDADRGALARRARRLRRRLLPGPHGHDLRPPGRARPGLHRGLRAGGRAPRRPPRRRVHLHQRQGRRAVHGHAAAGPGRGRREGRPGRRRRWTG